MAYDWLTEYVGLDLRAVDHVFLEINMIREIRNWAAHNYGLVKRTRKNGGTISYASNHNLLKVDDGRLEVKEGFLRYFNDLCYQFFGELERSISKV